ncbi:hypothetical protein LSCM1_02114 [Leishmania martiniquensis]|uniref:Ch34 protein n=1 Tax=Leishmania martiniquensis TaxID=1580590 RepID=A0A836KC14_9TRYP|nr:hypothetical protein LSCM1_02114 [Leishmania martiniquensis]
MGACCSASDTADSADSAAPPAPSNPKTAAKPSSSTGTFPRNPIDDLVRAGPPRSVTPSASAISALRGNGKEVPWTAARAAGSPAVCSERHTLSPPPAQSCPTLRVAEEGSSGHFEADAFSEPELMPVKSFTITPAEIRMTSQQPQLKVEAAEQQLVDVTALTPSSSDVTPERATAPTATPREGADRTRGPSTARVDEVPPTPKDENAKTLPADDARLLQRAPPPPPPLSAVSAVSATPKETDLDGEVRAEAVRNIMPEEAVAARRQVENVSVERQQPNPLADATLNWQEKQERYSTEVFIDATKDALLESSMGTGSSPSAIAAEEPTRSSSPRRRAHGVNGNAHGDVNAAPETFMSTIAVSGQLCGNPSDEIDRHIELATQEQQPKIAEDCFSNDTRPMSPTCSIQQPSLVEPICRSKEHQLESPQLHWEAAHGASVSPPMYRLLHPGMDVLWSGERANAPEVAAEISAELMLCGSGSEKEEAEEQGVARDLGSNAKKPITFTASSEIARKLESLKKSNEDSHPRSMNKDHVYPVSNTDVVDKLRPSVRNLVPSVALAAANEVAGEHVASWEKRATSEVQAAENAATADTEVPRRIPPPVPSQSNDDALVAQLPSRPAPPSLMSPPPA